jgi:hypothetical protein
MRAKTNRCWDFAASAFLGRSALSCAQLTSGFEEDVRCTLGVWCRVYGAGQDRPDVGGYRFERHWTRVTKFNVKFSDSTYRAVAELAKSTDGTMADVIREALSVYRWLAMEYQQGNRALIQRGDKITELVFPSLERLRLDASLAQGDDEAASSETIEDVAIVEPREGHG